MSMTPAEIQKALDAIKNETPLPKHGWFHPSVMFGQASITAYAPTGKKIAGAQAEDWPEAIENFRAAMIGWGVERDLGLARKMALSIIDLTDSGVCDMESLINAGFTADEIARYGAAACEVAAKMTSVEAYHIHANHNCAAE